MQLIISLVGGLLFSFIPWAIGHQITKKDIKVGIALKASVGWLVIYLLTLGLALGPGLNPQTLMSATIILFFMCFQTIYLGIGHLINHIKYTFRNSTSLETVILIFILLLLGFRFFQAMSPSTNWDSLNQHLPLVSSKIEQQDLSPIYDLPTDRRTPFSGILLKAALFCFGNDGRSISIAFFGLYIIIVLQLWNLLFKLCSRKAALFGCACLVSWTDIAVYFKHLGDEPFFCLFVIACISTTLIKPNLTRTHYLSATILGLAFSIKLTSLFFIPLIALLYLYKNFQSLKYLHSALCVILFIIFAITPYAKLHHDYNMIYPLQRWTNLLEFGPTTPEIFSFDYISEQRISFGLDDHRDNQKVSSNKFSKWFENVKKLIYLPLGPYIYWMLVLLLFAFLKRVNLSEQKDFNFTSFKLTAFTTLACLNLAMLAWSFSPQAMTRYLLPLWCIWAIPLGIFIFEYSKALKCETFLKFGLVLCLMFSCILEAKFFYKSLAKEPWQDSYAYWLKYSSDGPLISSWKELTDTSKNATFYMGNSSFLFRHPKHQIAQVGNEVGWREPQAFQEFLKDSELDYFIYSHQSKGIDTMYTFLKDYCLQQGRLTLLKQHPLGEIYKINH